MNGAAELRSCCVSLYELPITTLLLGPSFHPGGSALTRRLAELALVGRGLRVLDVASGTGQSARMLASHFGCEVTGVDLSAQNVALASERSETGGTAEQVRFVVGDAERLPFEDGSFDVVLCECALCTFPRMDLALDEMYRVLVPRGRLGLSDVILEREVPPQLETVLGHALCLAGALDTDGYRQAITEAGFAAVRGREVGHVLPELLERIEPRLEAAHRLAIAGELELPVDYDHARKVLAAARRFVESGGAGYALFTARKAGLRKRDLPATAANDR